MTHRLLLSSAGVIALLLVMSALGRQPTARADSSSMDWDVSMTDTGATANDPVCPSDTDNSIDAGECPQVSTNVFQDTKDTASNESGNVLSVGIWRTGPPDVDMDADTLLEPQSGLAFLTNLTHGTTVARATWSLRNNVVVGNLFSGNIDDVAGDYDTTVNGQPAVCGANQPGPTASFTDSFDLWSADHSNTNFVSTVDTDADTVAQTRDDDFSFGEDCMGTGGTPNSIPDGVDCTPDLLVYSQAALGLPMANFVGRHFGVTQVPVSLVTALFDINSLVYNLVSVPEVQGYITASFTGYAAAPAADPFAAGYNPYSQSVVGCNPYQTSPSNTYGITQNSDFIRGGAVELVTPREKHVVVLGTGNTYDAFSIGSALPDWDGDTIPSVYDRCRIDPASGTPAQDTDGDFLTGLCETLSGAGVYTNGEGGPGGNPLPGGPNTALPWDSGQDVDGGGYLNQADNCPIVPDRDLDNADGDGNPATGIDYQKDSDGDGVGDVCEITLAPILGWAANAYVIPGDGHGYPAQSVGDQYQIVAPGKVAPGRLVGRDNICSDPWTGGTAEATLDSGRWCAGFDQVGRPFGPTPSGIVALGRAFADSNNDGTPDLLNYPDDANTYPTDPYEWKDTNSDSDGDNHTDACEAYVGSDPLDPASLAALQESFALPSQCNNAIDDDGDTVVNDGCPGSGIIETGVQCTDAIDNGEDTPADGKVNDGCPRAGPVATPGDCDGDTTLDASDSNPFTGLNTDGDGDLCKRSQEEAGAGGVTPGQTGAGNAGYQDNAWYDVYDVPAPAFADPAPNGGRNGAVNVQDVVGVLKYVGAFENGPPNKPTGGVDYDSDKNLDGIKDGIDYDRSPSTAPNPPKDVGPPNGAVNVQDVVGVLGQTGRSCI